MVKLHDARQRPCYSCDVGVVRPGNIRGRSFDYRGEIMALGRDLQVPVCDACGEIYLTTALCNELNNILEEQRAAPQI